MKLSSMHPLKSLILILVLSASFSAKIFAQFSHADSTFLMNICKEGMYISYWNYPGTWYHHKEVSSLQNFYDQIDSSYIFENNEFADCYQKITTSNILERDTAINNRIDTFETNYNTNLFGNKNPFVKLKFNLNNKEAYSYALIDSTSAPVYNTDQAFVIISGTGTNQIKTILDGNGYHDMNCYVRNLLNPYGDIYIMSMPNEDHRAIYFNKKKISSLPNYQIPYLFTYLNAANKSVGLNRLIETIAFIKYLKTKYKKVFVLGLSTGGKVALWASLLSEPDASLIASGYSILVDNDYNAQLINSMSYGNYLLVYDKDSTKSRLGQLHTQFLFTQAQNDGALTQYDIDSSITKNFFYPLNNVAYFYNFYNHSFPPCPVIDSFVQRCIHKAKVFISTDTNVCNKDSLMVNLNFFGTPPFNFQLYRDTTFIASYSCNGLNYSFPLFTEGNYLIKNILDSAGNLGYTSDTFKYHKDVQPIATVTQKEFICDSSKTKLQFDFVGPGPFTIYYTKNAIPDSILLNHQKDSALFADGNYFFASIKGDNQCSNIIQNNITLNTNNLNFQVLTAQYNCATNKNDLGLQSSGELPIKLTFYDSTINSFRYLIMNNYAQTLTLDSGTYKFIQVTDSNNCSKIIDSTITLQSEPVRLSYNKMQYYCLDTFSVLPIQLKGKSSWNIEVERNGIKSLIAKNSSTDTIHLAYGLNKIVKVIDGNNCTMLVSDSMIQNNFRKLSTQVVESSFDCVQNEKQLLLHADGNFPLRAYGQNNGTAFETDIFTTPYSFLAKEGNFLIDSVNDQANCILKNIYTTSITNDTISEEGIYVENLTLKTSNNSFDTYYWYLDELLLKETAIPYISIEKSGTYQVGVFNNNNCLLKTKKLSIDLGKMNIYPNPILQEINILVRFDLGEIIQYRITDLLGNTIMQNDLRDGLNKIKLPEMNKGVYMIHFNNNLNNIKYPSQKIIKN